MRHVTSRFFGRNQYLDSTKRLFVLHNEICSTNIITRAESIKYLGRSEMNDLKRRVVKKFGKSSRTNVECLVGNGDQTRSHWENRKFKQRVSVTQHVLVFKHNSWVNTCPVAGWFYVIAAVLACPVLYRHFPNVQFSSPNHRRTISWSIALLRRSGRNRCVVSALQWGPALGGAPRDAIYHRNRTITPGEMQFKIGVTGTAAATGRELNVVRADFSGALIAIIRAVIVCLCCKPEFEPVETSFRKILICPLELLKELEGFGMKLSLDSNDRDRASTLHFI